MRKTARRSAEIAPHGDRFSRKAPAVGKKLRIVRDKQLEAARRVMNLVGSKENAGNLMYVLDMPWRNAARMANVFSDAQIKALLKVVNKEKGGWKKLVEETRRKK